MDFTNRSLVIELDHRHREGDKNIVHAYVDHNVVHNTYNVEIHFNRGDMYVPARAFRSRSAAVNFAMKAVAAIINGGRPEAVAGRESD